ncbi:MULTISPECIES: EAL domain-containing protein [unclassified Colwellia]|uniref:EAL domain-containing protein n=1 Tax=unclassified Colwellia TaxID=196834 RepID=UPI0015F416F2|nr:MULTISPECIES: GGDEF domain-containing protein [unclassified Colwellia]MBA6231021.1 GGDEF domain-containing protein [Colwellia sp. MB02u-7]MBA6234952.1 GGDEF domain-containing protein [Colwellia sp. MB02u-11]MBA6301507.1 GGDEF domain-containing protein [Colwellia sp. MB3u-22]MBA6312758.1 GGDEF domain-containing protein [Colwellia sp. MB3u-64]
MYSYFQLLIRNVLLGIFFNILIAVIVSYIFSSALSSRQLNIQKSIAAVVDISERNDQFKSVNKLMNLADFQLFSLTKENKDIFEHKTPRSNILVTLISPEKIVFTSELKTTISYQVNSNTSATLVLKIMTISILVSLIIIFIACSLSVKHTKQLVFVVNKKIKHGIAQVISMNKLEPDDEVMDIPELTSGLKKVEALISSHIDDTTALEKQAYIEPLTKLENRNRFIQFFANDENQVEFGVLAITRCSELQIINQIHGYNEGDHYICKVAEIIKSVTATYRGANVYRLNSSDFATLLPNITLKEAENAANELSRKFNAYQQSSDLDSVGYTGLVYFDKDKPLGELLALADTGISIAQTQQINAWFSQSNTDILQSASANYGNQNWRQEIESVLENQRLKLLVQQIKPNSRNNKVYGEILARFLNSSGEVLPTASFIAMAEKLDKMVAVDKMIIEKVINEIKVKNLHEQFFGINISARSIHDEHFLIWLERRLLKEATIASKLIFEITEYGLQQNIKTSKRFIDMIHRVGSRITVERFGVGLTSFKFFRDLKPDFIKMDSSYTRDIDDDKNNQYFIRLMVDLAHRLSITVLAESVESQEEKFTLEKLFIDGCQGFYLGKPDVL